MARSNDTHHAMVQAYRKRLATSEVPEVDALHPHAASAHQSRFGYLAKANDVLPHKPSITIEGPFDFMTFVHRSKGVYHRLTQLSRPGGGIAQYLVDSSWYGPGTEIFVAYDTFDRQGEKIKRIVGWITLRRTSIDDQSGYNLSGDTKADLRLLVAQKIWPEKSNDYLRMQVQNRKSAQYRRVMVERILVKADTNVDFRYRGQGIGTRLVKAGTAYAHAKHWIYFAQPADKIWAKMYAAGGATVINQDSQRLVAALQQLRNALAFHG